MNFTGNFRTGKIIGRENHEGFPDGGFRSNKRGFVRFQERRVGRNHRFPIDQGEGKTDRGETTG